MTAQLPPMGWNSWDCYGAAVNEDTVRANADYMAALHLMSLVKQKPMCVIHLLQHLWKS